MTPEQDNPTPQDTVGDDAQAASLLGKPEKKGRSSRFFVRGLATLLPAVLTLWLIVFAYGFIRDKIAAPINWGIQGAIIQFTDWPTATDDDYLDVWDNDLTPSQREVWEVRAQEKRRRYLDQKNDRFWLSLAKLFRVEPGDTDLLPKVQLPDASFETAVRAERLNWMKDQPDIVQLARRQQLQKRWDSIAIGNWHALDLIGLIVAIVLFYFAGVVMSNVLGRTLKDRGERLIDRVPLIRRVYPAVKQVTDFFFGDGEAAMKFNRVVAVEYPRKGIYSVGLVTGDTMQSIEDVMGEPCLTVFIPSSPTPFTGYVITVPVRDTIDLGITIEDALKFAVSGGVLVPASQVIDRKNDRFDRRGPTGDRREQDRPATEDPATPPGDPRVRPAGGTD
ncbi:MAG: DUF502 domain-containing protein [Phycisphaeraceae bacterium]